MPLPAINRLNALTKMRINLINIGGIFVVGVLIISNYN
jgi:hypothetical protein